MDELTTLGMRARARRIELGMTQLQVAAATNQHGFVTHVTRRDIGRVESGELTTPYFVEALARALDVQPTWLASGMSTSEHEQLLAGTLAAAGVATVDTFSHSASDCADEVERRHLKRVLMFLLGFIIGGSLVAAWAQL